ncbi:MAG: signal peptide peptidase SppA [Myxococcales bacterium]|nr:signal peptide peptidase SppA [Myxococcales bacterium]
MARLVASLVALLAATSFAQTINLANADFSRGVTLLPDSLAFADESTALTYNPAGLGRVDSWNVIYVHERSQTRQLTGNAIFAATSLGDTFGLGLGVNALSGGNNLTRFSVGTSFGPQAFSGGLSANWLLNGPTRGVFALDLGLQSRPIRWLSFGATVRNVNAPTTPTPDLVLAREWGLGVGLRPFDEVVTIGVDWYFPEQRLSELSRLQYTAKATIIRGLRVSAGVSHGFTPQAPLAFQAGLGVDLENFGYTQGFGTANGGFDFQFMGRLSGEKYASIVPAKKLAVISVGDIGSEGGLTVGSLLGVASEDRYLRFLRYLDRASRDPELAGVLIKIEGAGVGLARADEVRAAIERLRAAGKKVYAYILSVGDAEYLMASACDGIFSASEAMYIVDGVRSAITYFGGAAEQLGITVDVARVGAYKSFPDQFTRKDMSDEQRETLNAYLDTADSLLAERVTARRGMTVEAWKAGLDEGIKPPRRAKELGQIDDVVTPQQLDERVKAALPDGKATRSYRPFDQRDTRWGSKRKIAVVPVLGNIAGGKNQSSPIGGNISGAESFIEALREASEDTDVKAIILRVDSGGGDGLASDLMYRAVLEAKKKKPIIASMGDAAASGGYYVAMGADEIWANPTTLTGSIGVFYAKPAIKNFANKYGVTQESITRSKLAGIADFFEPWTEDQRGAAQKWIDDFYDTFITEVAASRKMKKEDVDLVARGRVWSGKDAKAKGLVDQLGGLMEAVRSAKVKGGIAEGDDDFQLSIVQAQGSLVGSLLGLAAPSLLEQPLPNASVIPAALDPIVKQLGPYGWLFGPPSVQARMEFQVDLR